MSDLGPANVTVAAKLPQELADGLAALAIERGITRSLLIRELAEAALEGQLQLPTVEEVRERDAGRMQERLRLNLRRSSDFRKSRPEPARQWDTEKLYEAKRARRARSDA